MIFDEDLKLLKSWPVLLSLMDLHFLIITIKSKSSNLRLIVLVAVRVLADEYGRIECYV